MAKNKILEIKQALGVTIECLEGSVWVTLDGDMRDVILDAGHGLQGRPQATHLDSGPGYGACPLDSTALRPLAI